MTMEELTFENVWGPKSDELITEIANKWKSMGVLPPDEVPEKRANQVVFLIRNTAQDIVGISTAYNLHVAQLKNHLLAFRGMIDPKYRYPGLFTKLVLNTFDYLEEVHGEIVPKPIGLLAEVENPNLLKIKQAVTRTGLIFIGYSRRGFPVRVRYFKGAKI